MQSQLSGPLPRRVHPVLIVWLFAGIVVCLLALTLYGSHLQSTGRALVASMGDWAKSQKDAVFFLSRYATDRRPGDLEAYERAMANVDAARARRGDFPFLKLTSVPAADALAEELREVARGLREGARDPAAVEHIHRINLRLAPLVDEADDEADAYVRGAQSLLTSGIIGIAGILLIGGIAVSRRLLAQNERLQQSLAESETQLRQMVEAAPLPLLIVRASDQKLVYVNERALEQFGLNVDTALSRSLAEFHVDDESRTRLAHAISRDGTVRDFEVNLLDARGRSFWLLLSAQPIRYLGSVCLLVALADIDERKRLQDDMRRKAMHDTLTGLPNRAMFMESLERAVHKSRRRSTRFSVLFIDLDRFKEINDTMGHHAGDALLQEVGRRLEAAVRQSDMVARLAGDEFVVLIEEHGGPEEVMIVAMKVLSALQAPIMIDWREAKVSGSVGIASYPEDGTDVPQLVKNADTAMYQAKERGRNNFQFYSPDLNELSRERFEQEKRIRGALERGEFFLEYQPEVDIASGKVVAVEALLRWKDPVAGVTLPAAFMQLAEETGTIAAIGLWVLDRALADLRAWRAAGADFKLSVNIAARQLHQQDLPGEVTALVKRHGLEPSDLRFDITEPALMLDAAAADTAVRTFKALGIEVAIDDFGTGYSSLGLVRGLPIDVVKIDRSLVSSCTSKRECAAIVQAAAAMSKVLGIRVVAEGVETEEQREAVLALGCDAMQGYLVARPTDAAGIAAMTRAAAEQTLFA
jgi:diguanylate cyclase (GGDEF)-like protein/PAS domain S-box-containing protein